MSARDPYTYDLALSDSEGSSSSIDVGGNSKLRISREQPHHHRDILDEEQEQQDLLLRRDGVGAADTDSKGILGRMKDIRVQKKSRGARRRASDENDETKELVYEMEEGGRRSFSSRHSEDNSSELDREKLGMLMKEKTSRRRKCFTFTCIYFLIAVAFIGIAFGAYRASRSIRKKPASSFLRSNGTSLFAPTTVLISLDGFRADFLKRGLTPTLNSFIKEGVSPPYMNPSFPSLTFPNHFTLVTGLYPESHGVVGNTFWAPEFEEQFFYTHPKYSMQPKWWNAEPLWVTAEDQQVPTAIHMWPGSEAHIGDVEPTYLDRYNGTEVLPRKVDRILELLDIPGTDDTGASLNQPRPQLIAAYVPNVDADGHLYGPNSTEIRNTITDVDTMLEDVFQGLEQRNLTDIVNVIVVSDHGMATTSTSRLLQLEDLVDPDLIDMIDGWPHYGLRLKDPSQLDAIYSSLSEKSSTQDGFDVYLRDKNMPKRYHFINNDRIAPLWIMPKPGWAIVTKDEFNIAEAVPKGDEYHPKGLHGYDHEHPLMRAIFIARGPAFPHKPGSRLDAFQNTEVYNIVCDSIGVTPHPSNGTLRLPLKPIGFHDVEESHEAAEESQVAPTPSVSSFIQSASDDADSTAPTRPVVDDGKSGDEQKKPTTASEWWAWVKLKYKDFSAWANNLVGGFKEKMKGDDKNEKEGD